MEEIRMFCESELGRMDRDEIICAYLSLKERFLEQLAIDAEKDLLVKNLSERLNLDNARQFGRSTETASSLSGARKEKEPDAPARNALPESDAAPDTAGPSEKKRPKRKPGCAQRIKDGLPVRDIHVTLTPEKLKELFGNYQWRELPDQSYDVLRYRKACLYIERRHIHVYTAGGKVVRAGKVEKMLPKSLMSPEILAGVLDAKFVMGLPVSRLEQQFARAGGSSQGRPCMAGSSAAAWSSLKPS